MRTEGQTEGRTDMTKLIIVFLNFANAPKTVTTIYLSVLACRIFQPEIYEQVTRAARAIADWRTKQNKYPTLTTSHTK
jgi:hypothetical protein